MSCTSQAICSLAYTFKFAVLDLLLQANLQILGLDVITHTVGVKKNNITVFNPMFFDISSISGVRGFVAALEGCIKE